MQNFLGYVCCIDKHVLDAVDIAVKGLYVPGNVGLSVRGAVNLDIQSFTSY